MLLLILPYTLYLFLYYYGKLYPKKSYDGMPCTMAKTFHKKRSCSTVPVSKKANNNHCIIFYIIKTLTFRDVAQSSTDLITLYPTLRKSVRANTEYFHSHRKAYISLSLKQPTILLQ
jgi:hypothetical protein